MRSTLSILVLFALGTAPASAQEIWPGGMAQVSFLGPDELSGAGRVSGIGDLDDDGMPDFAIGAPMDDTEWPDAGRAFLFSGDRVYHRNMDIEAEADVIIGGGAASDLVGWSVDGVGDINGDGFDDLALGVLLDRVDDGSGTVRIFFGPWDSWGETVDMEDADVTIRAEHLYTGTGMTTVNAGDVDGDGIDDIWIGAPYSKLDPFDPGAMEVEELKIGRVHLVLGREVWPSALDLIVDSHIYFTGDAEGGLMGSTIAAGDINADGIPDMCVGSPGAVVEFMEGVGQVHCFTNLHMMAPGEHMPGEARFIVIGPDENTRAGTSLAFTDYNGDHIMDVVIGAPYADESVNSGGSVVGYPGGPNLPMGFPGWGTGGMHVRGDEENGCFGYELANAGDLGEDGYEDILIGAPGTDADHAEAVGRVYTLMGRLPTMPFPASTDDIPIRIEGEFGMDRIGTHLAGVGDLGWGYPVFMVGSSHAAHNGHEAGKALLFHSGMTLDDDGDGYSEIEGDCRDDDPDSHPGETDATDSDDDCDGWTEDDGDCDDTCANCFPGAPEIADELDNDCDGDVDEIDVDATDDDGDGWTAEDGDCDDGDDEVYPGATEVCNDIDDNCNGMLDEVEGGCDEGDDDDDSADPSDDDDDTAVPADDDDDDGCDCTVEGRSSVRAIPALALLGALLLRRRQRT
jgi:MYXO-CTERM domain-containing protein